MQEGMVAQVRIGVADGDREREHRAEPAQLVRSIVGVRGQQRRKAPVESGVLGRLVLVRTGRGAPQSLAAVFLKPVRRGDKETGLPAKAVELRRGGTRARQCRRSQREGLARYEAWEFR